MKKHLAIVAAAAFALGGVSVTWAQEKDLSDKTEETAQDVRAKTAEKVGVGSADQASQHQSPSAEAIHDVMAQVAEAAFTKDGLDDIAERLVDADRNRLGQDKEALKSDEALNNQVDQLAKDWKAKYTDEFNIKDEDKVYNLEFARITEGEIGEQARPAGETIRDDAARTDTGIDAPTLGPDGQTAADRNVNDPGRNIATVRIAESHGLAALDVPMVREAGGWKFDIPDTVDAAKFKSNLSAALTDISNKKDQWPADADGAYQYVTHCVLLAIYDKMPAAEAGADTGQSQ